jgi:hypothetical protein
MQRKDDAHRDELEGVAQRLRDERPQASPLDLDRIKTTAMARAKAGTRRGGAGARRLAVAGLTVGLLAATTGGVLAGENGHHKGKDGGGNAANAQYGGECNISNGSGNIGDNNGQNSENNACNENTFITENNNSNVTNNVTNNYNSSTVTISAPANNGVQGATTSKKAATSNRHVKIHINLARRSKLRKVTLRVNGKIVSVLKGKRASRNITLVSLPCSAKVTITAVTASGKTVTQTHTYTLC